jgi:hypothetical protein
LAGESSAENIDRFDGCPIDGRNVAEVRNSRIIFGENLRWRGVEFTMPNYFGVEYGHYAHFEAAVA